MLISCPCCKRKISNTAETCPWCGCDVQKELRENIEFAIWCAKWGGIPFIIFIFSVFVLSETIENNGGIFGKYVGDSEANIRQALKTAEAIAPCVLWIDEIEKGLSGGGSDGGTSSRVFGNILTWMQDKTSPVFTFATANNIRNLPPELLRKGRFDEIFFVDLPDFEERKKILEIHIGKSGRNLANFDLDKLAKMSGEDNYGTNVRLAGAEIEAWVKDALMEAYARKANGDINADLSMQDFETVIKRMIPMAKMRQEDFKDLRDWANENAVSASVSSATTSNSNDSLGGRRIDLI